MSLPLAIPFPPLSPEIVSIEIGGLELALRWYALAYIVGLLVGWRMIVGLMKRPALWPAGGPPMKPEMVEQLLTWVVLGVVLGGRLGYVIFYKPMYYARNPLDILRIWDGGMAFHGGFIGVVLVVWWFCRIHRLPLPQVADAMAMATPPGLLFGRIANFINAELWGRPTDLPWGVIFPGELAQSCPVDWVGPCARHPSQLYEAALEGLILGAVLLWLAYRRDALRRPWQLTGVFLAGYGIGRFIVELFRQPDPQFVSVGNPVGYAVQFDAFGLTQGQLLSLPMIAAGLLLVAWARLRRPMAA